MTEICPRCGQVIDHENDIQASYAELLKELEFRNILGLYCDMVFTTAEPVDDIWKRKHVELDADTTDKIIGFLKLIEHEGITE